VGEVKISKGYPDFFNSFPLFFAGPGFFKTLFMNLFCLGGPAIIFIFANL